MSNSISQKRFLCPYLLIVFCFIAFAGKSQNYSGLQGKELYPVINQQQIIGSLVERLLYGDFSGTVSTVKVLDDREASLTINVNFLGTNEGYLHASIVDNNMHLLKGFSPQKSEIKDKKDIEFKFELDGKQYPQNDPFVAPMLLVLVSKSDKGAHGVRTVYKLNKKFNPENTVIPVGLIPVMSAAALPANLPSNDNGGPKFTLPQRNVYELIKDKPVYLHSAGMIKAAPTTATSTGTTAVKKDISTKYIAGTATPAMSVLKVMQPVGSVTPAAPSTNKSPEGPEDKPLSFWGDFIYSDVDFESQMKITSVSLNIYPDKNHNSGIFYYLPIAYDIKYDKERGFAFNVDYGTTRSEGTENKVRMSGTLTSGITLYEIQFIKNLMEAYKKYNPSIAYLETPLPMPIAETPVITLSDELKDFGISSVNINNASSITDPIEFSWVTDGTTATEIENLLKANSGITGKMKIKPQGGAVPMQEIPVRIRMIDENTFGRFGMTPSDFRTKNWRNETPFPVKLKYLHYMIIDKNKNGVESPIIYSWDLSNTEIQPKKQVQFAAGAVPQWLDNYKNKQARIWLDYNIVDTCTACKEQAFSGIISSVTRPQLSDVTFRIIPFFEEYKIAYMDVEVKSIQGDPSGKTETTFPVTHIIKDDKDYGVGKIYVPVGTEPAFNYRITVVTKEGVEMKSNWISRNSLNVPFGSSQLVEQFPQLKKN